MEYTIKPYLFVCSIVYNTPITITNIIFWLYYILLFNNYYSPIQPPSVKVDVARWSSLPWAVFPPGCPVRSRPPGSWWGRTSSDSLHLMTAPTPTSEVVEPFRWWNLTDDVRRLNILLSPLVNLSTLGYRLQGLPNWNCNIANPWLSSLGSSWLKLQTRFSSLTTFTIRYSALYWHSPHDS